MDPPPGPIRSLVLTPVALVGSLVAIAISPVLFVVSTACDLVDRKRWRFTRLLALGVAFCVLEFAALIAALAIRVATGWRRSPAAGVAAHQAVLAWWAD